MTVIWVTSAGSGACASGRHHEQQGHLGEWGVVVDLAVPLPPLRLDDVKTDPIAVGETVREPDTERDSPDRCCCCGWPLNGFSSSTNSRSCQSSMSHPVNKSSRKNERTHTQWGEWRNISSQMQKYRLNSAENLLFITIVTINCV